ncbi:MAG: HD family hydrolase [Asgard group archaeon]|nr:HD family hydrolase [Asgard group archaeon]
MSEDIQAFFEEAIRIKQTIRSGWVVAGVPLTEVESVADHSYFVSLIALILSLEEIKKGKRLDLQKVLIMALLHDLSESISQDIDRCIKKFSSEKYSEFKRELDDNATKTILAKLPEELMIKLLEYHKEFTENKSLEAKIVVEADRLDVALQQKAYQKRGLPKELFANFHTSLKDELSSFQLETAKQITKEILGND